MLKVPQEKGGRRELVGGKIEKRVGMGKEKNSYEGEELEEKEKKRTI